MATFDPSKHFGHTTSADKTTGLRLKKLRKKLKVRAKNVAESMDIQRSFLCDLEAGRRRWTQERVAAFEKAVGGSQ